MNSSTATESKLFTIKGLFLAWLRIGLTSFGGGTVTQYLIQESFIYKRQWITGEEYAKIMAMSQIVPGINIIAYTILIGKRLGGWTGIGVSLLGLILPSAAITVGISSIYASFSEVPKVQASLRTVFAAIFGIAIATSWRNVQPIITNNRNRGVLAMGVTLVILIGSALVYVCFNPPVFLLYLFGGLCGALAYSYMAKKERRMD